MKRALWEVWKDGAVWMVQGPKARVHFNSRKTAREVATRGAALAAKAALEALAEKLKGGRA